MSSRLTSHILVVGLVLIVVLTIPTKSYAQPAFASSAIELINAVNALRTSNGLPAYSVSPILMFTAQNQADFMAANGIVTHAGPDGIGLTDRLLAAGYPLAGDLSHGGFRAENITGGSESMTAQSAVDQWTGDAPHLNTMLSPALTEIGAGVSVADGKVYYVIDAAQPTTSGAPQNVTPVVGGGATVPAGESPAPVVLISTPNRNGEIIHEVMVGQTLWQIAISYDVTIEDVKRLNNLADDSIFPGDKLLIAKDAEMASTPTAAVESTRTLPPLSTQTFTPAVTSVAATSTPGTINLPTDRNSNVLLIMIGIIAIAILGGWLFTWFGNSRRE